MLGQNALNYNKLKDERVVLDQNFPTSSFFLVLFVYFFRMTLKNGVICNFCQLT